MSNGIITFAQMLATGNAWQGPLTFGFWVGESTEFTAKYGSASTGRSPTPSDPIKSYVEGYDPEGLSETDKNFIRTIISDGVEFVSRLRITEGGLNSTLRFGALNFNVTPEPGKLTLAWATEIGRSNNLLAGDFWVTKAGQNDGILAASGVQGNTPISAWVLPHELGHVLGLSHPQNISNGFWPWDPSFPDSQETLKYSIMAYGTHPSEGGKVFDFQLYDIASLQKLYGANHSANSGTSTYKDFHEKPPVNGIRQIGGSLSGSFDRIFSIWDGGGKDRIDASAYDDGAYVDLRPGYFSSIGPKAFVDNGSFRAGKVEDNYTVTPGSGGQLGRENISIAFGAYIEDATGSSANDVIIGNMLSNEINAGAGNDLIFGDGLAIDIANALLVDELGLVLTNLVSHVASASQDADYRQIEQGGIGAAADGGFSDDRTKQEDVLDGGDGNDLIVGTYGKDTLKGEAGDDILIGGEGDDTLDGGAGDNILHGGEGDESVRYDEGAVSLSVRIAPADASGKPKGRQAIISGDAGAGALEDTLIAIEKVLLSTQADTIKVKSVGTGDLGGLIIDMRNPGGGTKARSRNTIGVSHNDNSMSRLGCAA